jgi:diguanylate cyclase (GGDEF)-like protein/PAS domain S-box-containing protein
MRSLARVLVVEDDDVDRLAFTRLARTTPSAYDLTFVSSVQEATSVLRDAAFDAVVTDFDLGDGSALDVMAVAGDAAVVVVTGAGAEDKAVAALKAGALDYVVKDIERAYVTKLPSTIDDALRTRDRERTVRMLAQAVRSVADAVLITTPDDTIVFVNQAFCALCGHSERELLGTASTETCSPAFGSRRSPCGASPTDVALRTRTGDELDVALTTSTVDDERGHVVAVVHVVRDVTARRRAELDLRRAHDALEASRAAFAELSVRDELTGLYNRREMSRVLAALTSAGKDGPSFSLLLFDIDHFKRVNDTYGHPVGDEVIRHVAAVMQACAPRGARLFRYGGEELVVVLPGADGCEACDVADQLRASIAASAVERHQLVVTVSVGIATMPEHASDSGALFASADEALYRAKRGGRNRVETAATQRAA